jgi:hypothetical protein
MVVQLAAILNIDIDEITEKLMQSDRASKQLLAMLKALSKFEDNGQNEGKTDIQLATA